MNHGLDILNPLAIPAWNTLLGETAGCTVFHSSNWARVLHDSYGYKPAYLASEGRSGFATLLPMMDVMSRFTGRRGISLPFTDYCTPLTHGGGERDVLFTQAVEHGRRSGWKYYELRHHPLSGSSFPRSAEFLTHDMHLSQDEDSISAGLHESARRGIRKAMKAGVTAEMSDSIESTMAFCRLNDMTRRRHGLPPQPRAFFRNIHRHMIAAGLGDICLARYGRRPVAGSLFLRFGNNVVYKYAASDPRYLPLCAGFLAVWTALMHYAREGYHSLCFGRTHPMNGGLLRFKRSWGTRESALAYQRWDLHADTPVLKSAERHEPCSVLFRNLPIILLRCVGQLLYRHMA